MCTELPFPCTPVKLLPYDHEVMGSNPKQPLAEMQGKAAYIRPKVVGPFPKFCASRSYMHQAALYKEQGVTTLV
jgi:hypothetical protein